MSSRVRICLTRQNHSIWTFYDADYHWFGIHFLLNFVNFYSVYLAEMADLRRKKYTLEIFIYSILLCNVFNDCVKFLVNSW